MISKVLKPAPELCLGSHQAAFRYFRHWALAAAHIAMPTSPTTAQPASAQSSTPTVATPIDASVDGLVGCSMGGHLHFLVGAHRVRVDPLPWKLRVRLPDNKGPSKASPAQACEKAPLRVRWLTLSGPAGRELVTARGLTLADGTDSELRQIRDDFRPIESSCRRGPHWTWCSDAAGMKLVHPNDIGSDPEVSVKFDPDFYRTPTGSPFFVSSNGDRPLNLGRWGVVYRWDETLVLAYHSYPCTRPTNAQEPICNPLIHIDIDRDVRRLVQGLLDDEPVSSKKLSAKPQNTTR